MRDVTKFWQKNALDNIMPDREGAEFPDGEVALAVLTETVGEGKVLEFGCGRGRLAPLFDAKCYVGVDISPSAIKQAKKDNPEHDFRLIKPFSRLPKVDVVFAYTVLHHIPDEFLEKVVSQMAKCASRMVIAEIMDTRFRHEKKPPCLNRDASEYESLFSAHGFEKKQHHVVEYSAYQDRRMTILELC